MFLPWILLVLPSSPLPSGTLVTCTNPGSTSSFAFLAPPSLCSRCSFFSIRIWGETAEPESRNACTRPDPRAPSGPKEIEVDDRPAPDRKGILRDYAVTLAVQHAYRITRDEVRAELDGPYFRDYVDAVTHLKQGFSDGDGLFWNFVVHPLQGGIGYHTARSRGASRWESLLWTALYTVHFELSPLGQAGIGNNRVSPLDLVVTPTTGFL